MISNIKRAAQGKWQSILPEFGIDADALTKRGKPCPCCGGVDRFIFDDIEGNGTHHCRGCGAGDGIELAQKYTNRPLAEILSQLETMLGLTKDSITPITPVKRTPISPESPTEDNGHLERPEFIQQVLSEGATEGYHEYLKKKRLPMGLGRIASKKYTYDYVRDGKQCKFYIHDGDLVLPAFDVVTKTIESAQIIRCRKDEKRTLPGPISGLVAPTDDSYELFDAGDIVCLAEGWATAYAAQLEFNTPTLAVLGTANFRHVCRAFRRCNPHIGFLFYGDNDQAGIKAVNSLVEEFGGKGLFPEQQQTDFADLHVSRAAL